MDNKQHCKLPSVHFHYVGKGDTVVVSARSQKEEGIIDTLLSKILDNDLTSCSLAFAPKYEDKKYQFLSIKFTKFWISSSSCDASLTFIQSPAAFFDREVNEIVSMIFVTNITFNVHIQLRHTMSLSQTMLRL